LRELIKLFDQRGLSVKQFTRIEPKEGTANPRWYTPAADIGNLFPCLLSVAINDLESEYKDEVVDGITEVMLKQILPALYKEMPDKEGDYSRVAAKVGDRLKYLYSEYPEAMRKVANRFLYFSLIAYAIAMKNGLREMPTVMGGNGVFRYFAMLAVWDHLKPETQKAVVEDLAEQNLWGANPDDL
jgi:hypothetical protein